MLNNGGKRITIYRKKNTHTQTQHLIWFIHISSFYIFYFPQKIIKKIIKTKATINKQIKTKKLKRWNIFENKQSEQNKPKFFHEKLNNYRYEGIPRLQVLLLLLLILIIIIIIINWFLMMFFSFINKNNAFMV